MGYMHIENLYKAQDILLFRRCYAMEKVHGSSAHVAWKPGVLNFFAGGSKQETFEALFDKAALLTAFEGKFAGTPIESCTVYGEAYGGKMQGMSKTYGSSLLFIAFDVYIDHHWLAVPKAEDVVKSLGLEFVPWKEIDTDLPIIDAERDKPSEVAVRRGIAGMMPREGIVLRPLIEVTTNNGERIIAKHKGEAFQERGHQPHPVDADRAKILSAAEAIAEEWVTPMRLQHVLDAIHPGWSSKDKAAFPFDMKDTGTVIKAMIEDVEREAKGEILESKDARKAIGARAAWLFKDCIKKIMLGVS